jgi:hypothetical protein
MNLGNQLESDPTSYISLTDDATLAVVSRVNPLVGHIISCFDESRMARRTHEARWLRAYQNFRGTPVNNNSFITSEVSKAFIKITKTKTLAAYGQLLDIYFATGKLPLAIEASLVPLGAPDRVHVDVDDPIEAPQQQAPQMASQPLLGFPGDGNDLKPGETLANRALGYIKQKLGDLVKVKEGSGDKPNRIIFKPAEDAAFLMNRRVHDQLEDMRAGTTVRQSTWEKCTLGTGIIKGPLNKMQEYPDWDEEGNYTPQSEEIPNLRHVSIWNFYPDAEATNQGNLEHVIERHRMSRSQLRALKAFRSFRASAIDEVVNNYNPNYTNEDFENQLDENAHKVVSSKYEVLEFWGTVDVGLIEDLGIDLGFEIPEDVGELPVNVWICQNQILRLVMNPLVPARLPYYICPYEFNPYSVFGVGVPENMEDTQVLMNGFMRLAVDNAVLSGSVMLEVDESVMAPGQDYKVETGKVFRKSGGAPNQKGVQSIVIQNTAQQNMQMFDVARRLADESTGIPSFSHGMTGVQGVGRTSSGISMLLNAAAGTTKTVVKNGDDYWFEPIGQAMYYWNMQFKFDAKLRGDISAVAKGTKCLMEKEEKSQHLLQFAQVAFTYPALAPWVNAKEWLVQFTQSINLDVQDLLNRPDEAQVQAQIIQMAGGLQAGGSPAAPQTGGTPTPGQPGFTGNNVSSGNQAASQGASSGASAATGNSGVPPSTGGVGT